PDGKTLATASRMKATQIWDVNTGTLVKSYNLGAGMFPTVAFTAGGRILVGTAESNVVPIWKMEPDAGALEVEMLHIHRGGANCLAVSPDGKLVAVPGSGAATIEIWDLQTGVSRFVLTGHLAAVRALTFSADGARLASGAEDKTLR